MMIYKKYMIFGIFTLFLSNQFASALNIDLPDWFDSEHIQKAYDCPETPISVEFDYQNFLTAIHLRNSKAELLSSYIGPMKIWINWADDTVVVNDLIFFKKDGSIFAINDGYQKPCKVRIQQESSK